VRVTEVSDVPGRPALDREPDPVVEPLDPVEPPMPFPPAAARPPLAPRATQVAPDPAAAMPEPPVVLPQAPAASLAQAADRPAPNVVIEQISVVTAPAPGPAVDPFASLAGRRRAESRHRAEVR
jgi:hypothetical protein